MSTAISPELNKSVERKSLYLLPPAIIAGYFLGAIPAAAGVLAGCGVPPGAALDAAAALAGGAIEHLRREGPTLVFTNLVDFDSKYGHRNDPAGYFYRFSLGASLLRNQRGENEKK